MTKELESLLNELNIQNYNLYSALFDELTINNVCISKGENRHPYADILHEWAEGAKIEFKTIPVNCTGVWVEYDIVKNKVLRLKPSEPVYEYLWYNADGDTKWMTLDEAKEFERPWFWAKETSRMRQ